MRRRRCRAAGAGGAPGGGGGGGGGGRWALPAGGPPAAAQLEEKRSRFVALAGHAASPAAALAFVEAHRQPGASHNCWAYRVGPESRSTDDGEPGGTAGRPILAALEAEGVDRACVLVVRHYGGTKLGTGGLARAYGGAARLALRGAELTWVRPEAELSVSVAFEHLGALHTEIQRLPGCRKEAEEFGEGGARLRVRLEADLVERFESAVLDATGGKAEVETLG